MRCSLRTRIDGVIHFAGLKAVGESVAEPLRYFQVNLGTTLTLAETMADHDVKRLVFSSSATVYSPQAAVPLHEDAVTGPTNPYGETKAMIERILTAAGAADPDLAVALLRYFNPVGAHESGRIGEDPAGIPNNLMPFVMQVAVGKLPELSVFGDDYDTPDGTCIRDYIHVVDLARGHVAALRRLAEDTGGAHLEPGHRSRDLGVRDDRGRRARRRTTDPASDRRAPAGRSARVVSPTCRRPSANSGGGPSAPSTTCASIIGSGNEPTRTDLPPDRRPHVGFARRPGSMMERMMARA